MLIGNLTRDPELRYTPKGTPVASFRLATNRQWRESTSDELREETQYTDIVVWSKLAEICNQWLKKGMKVYIEGRLSTRTWEDATTHKRVSKTEVVGDDMIILGYPRGMQPPTQGQQGQTEAAPPAETPVAEVQTAQAAPAEVTSEVPVEEVPAEEVKGEIPF